MNLITLIIALFSISANAIVGGEIYKMDGVHKIKAFKYSSKTSYSGNYSSGKSRSGVNATGFFVSADTMIIAAHTAAKLVKDEFTHFSVFIKNKEETYRAQDLKIFIPDTYFNTTYKKSCDGDFAVVKLPNKISSSYLKISKTINSDKKVHIMGYGDTRSVKDTIQNFFLNSNGLRHGYNKIHEYFDGEMSSDYQSCLADSHTITLKGSKRNPSFNSAYHWSSDSGSPVMQDGKVIGVACGINYSLSKTDNYSYFVNITTLSTQEFLYKNLL